MSFLEQCEEQFGSKDLYNVLNVSKDASEKQIKAAYRKMSLKVHPDRVTEEEKALATEKFQILGKVYSVLSDEERRKLYDESGCVDNEIDSDIFNWKQFWSSRFGNLNDAIKEFTDEYWGSEKEKDDLKKAYEEYKGDMNKIIQNMYCRALDHEQRYRELIEEWIKAKELPNYDKFSKETKAKRLARKRKYEKEAKHAEKNAKVFEKEMGDSISDIASIIAQRNEDRMKKQEAFLDQIAAKYVKPKNANSKKKKTGTSKKKSP
uniref:dnaJ homolog subfamily C member 9-like n=1 Tax=Styela clava TaxID=7725 RepID=UPI00193AA0FD|nr:dnaJ homolog subfamily C member 9-like [Styela clava]